MHVKTFCRNTFFNSASNRRSLTYKKTKVLVDDKIESFFLNLIRIAVSATF